MTSKSKKKTQPELIEFRQISSIAEYRLYDDSYNVFGIECSNPDQCWSAWKALTGSVMLTLTPSELRSLANAIEHK